MNWRERIIAAFSPRWAARRKTAEKISRYIERLDSDFDVNVGHPALATTGRPLKRAVVARLVAGNPYASRALSTLVNNAVGWGITGAPKGPKTLAALWEAWLKNCDFMGRLDLYGLQEVATRTMLADGEVFIVFRIEDVPGVPLRLHLLDRGMLATSVIRKNIDEGIEYDDAGKPVAYHFYIHRPGTRLFDNRTVRYSVEDVIHLFVQEHPGQRRGRSIFEPVIKRLGDIDDSLEAEIVRKKIEACFVAFRTLPIDMPDEGLGEREDRGYDLPPAETFEPGMIETMRPGEDVKFGDPKPSGGLEALIKIELMSTAAGLGVMYEHISGDLSNVNYSSYRAGSLEFQRSIGRLQFNTLIPVFLERVWSRFQEEARIRGMIANRSYEMKWTPPPFESVDPEKTAQGDILLMQAGLESRRNLVNGRGYDFDTLMAEIAEDQATQSKLGLAFKGDPFNPGVADNAGT